MSVQTSFFTFIRLAHAHVPRNPPLSTFLSIRARSMDRDRSRKGTHSLKLLARGGGNYSFDFFSHQPRSPARSGRWNGGGTSGRPSARLGMGKRRTWEQPRDPTVTASCVHRRFFSRALPSYSQTRVMGQVVEAGSARAPLYFSLYLSPVTCSTVLHRKPVSTNYGSDVPRTVIPPSFWPSVYWHLMRLVEYWMVSFIHTVR